VKSRGKNRGLISVRTLVVCAGFFTLLLGLGGCTEDVRKRSCEDQQAAEKAKNAAWRQPTDYEMRLTRQKKTAEIDHLLQAVAEVQNLMASRQPGEALKLLSQLEHDHPDLAYLSFLKASCLVLIGDQTKAKSALVAALREFPEDKAGQLLYKQLGGKDVPTKQEEDEMDNAAKAGEAPRQKTQEEIEQDSWLDDEAPTATRHSFGVPLPPMGTSIPLLNPSAAEAMPGLPAGNDAAMSSFLDDPFDQPVTSKKQGPQ
jgi:hypothetical protein